MSILQFALQLELDGEKYYRQLAAQTQYEELKYVLEQLADDEQRHYHFIQEIEKAGADQIVANPSLQAAQNVFSGNRKFTEVEAEKLKTEQIDLYRAAVIKEQESIDLYNKIAEEAINPGEKSLAGILAREEGKHKEILETIVMMLNNVNDWVESAEFNRKATDY